MNLLTSEQKEWLFNRTIKSGENYMFPRWGFTAYLAPKFNSESVRIDINPMTKSLDHELFAVKEIVNGFCRGNYVRKPKTPDFYIHESELKRRDLIEVALLYATVAIPMIIYNLLIYKKHNGRKKLSKSE